MSALSDAIRTGEEAYLERFKIMLYSWPGAGKTTLAAGAPRPLFIEVDDAGHVVFRNLPPSIRAGVQFYHSQDWEKLVKFAKALGNTREVLASIDTIVLDTVSALQSIERERQIRNVDILVEEKSPFHQAIYAANNQRIMRFVQYLLRTGKNLIINCHMQEDTITVGTSEKKLLRPGISPTLTRELMTAMDACFFLALDGQTRTLRLASGTDVLTKSRFRLGETTTMKDPTWSKLEPYIKSLMRKTSSVEVTHTETIRFTNPQVTLTVPTPEQLAGAKATLDFIKEADK